MMRQVTTDELASALLERIREERAATSSAASRRIKTTK